MRMFVLLVFIFGQGYLLGQQTLLKNGPMVSQVTLRSAIIWLQTSESTQVFFKYRKTGTTDNYTISDQKTTNKEDHFTVSITLDQIEPGQTYEYQVYINNQLVRLPFPTTFTSQIHWQHRTNPPNFDFIAGSCFYINEKDYDRLGKAYGASYDIVTTMLNQKPDFMIWLGDNTYFREGDFETRAGMYRRHTHTRSLPELAPFLASVPQYAIWDDHDYGPNDSDWTYMLKHHALDAFKDFWPSEAYGSGHLEGITNGFYWNDCQFFLLDNRWYRTVERENGTILGEQQKYWLKEALMASKSTFKFVCIGGQFLSDFKGYENFANYESERSELIQFINDYKINGVVFLTGDRHHSEITKLTTENGQVIYDVTSSPITSGTSDHSKEINLFRIPNSMVSVNNFAHLSISGPKNKRIIDVSFIDLEGQIRFSFTIDDLQQN